MRKIFIDCGFYCGGALKLFKKTPEYDESFELFAFDANKLSEKKAEHYKQRKY